MSSPLIIGAFANVLDANSKLNELDREYKGIDRLWREQSAMDFIGIPNAQALDIFEELKRKSYQSKIVAFHFAGHAGHTRLILESEKGSKVQADGRALASYLGTMSGLKLVFLNGCATAPLAQTLLAAKIPIVIATTYSVEDAMAADLAINFYQEISLGKSIGRAFVAARSQVNIELGRQREIHIRAYRGEIPLASVSDIAATEAKLPWGMYYQPGVKPDELFLFDPPENKSILLKSKSGDPFILEMEALERSGKMDQVKLWMMKKDRYETALVYEQDIGVIFKYEHELEKINKMINELGNQLGIDK